MEFTLPSLSGLDKILNDVKTLKKEMRNRCQGYWKHDDAFLDSELLLIDPYLFKSE